MDAIIVAVGVPIAVFLVVFMLLLPTYFENRKQERVRKEARLHQWDLYRRIYKEGSPNRQHFDALYHSLGGKD